MALSDIFRESIGNAEGQKLEYKATLVSARAIAQILSGFANTDGGILIFGIREHPKKRLEISGLSDDFKVVPIFNKAQTLLEPLPCIESSYFDHKGKTLFGILISKSSDVVLVEGKKYERRSGITVDADAPLLDIQEIKSPKLLQIKETINQQRQDATSPHKRFLDHYQNVLRLYESMLPFLFPVSIVEKTNIPEGKTFNRLLYSSSMDNFETYLSELLYEIYLANPNALKAREAVVKVEDVLRCNDIDEFIQRLAARKVGKLQKGSIKGFLKDNVEIKSLDVLSEEDIIEIEKALQIRHLYSHRNGIVDESFLEFFGDQYTRNTEHQLSVAEVLSKMEFLMEMVKRIDEKVIEKYSLSTKEPM